MPPRRVPPFRARTQREQSAKEPARLQASRPMTMHTGCIVRDRPFGPVKVWLVDGAGNPLSMGDVPLHLSVRPETREGGGEASCADIECELLSRCTRQPARALPPSSDLESREAPAYLRTRGCAGTKRPPYATPARRRVDLP